MTPTEPPPRIPFVDLAAQSRRLRPEIDRRIADVLDHGRYVMGPEVDELEAELGRWGGGVSAVAVSSGSDALLIALLALGVGGGGNRRDAVFVPAFTFTATAEVVLLAGAVPVFVDVREEDFLIDLDSLDREYEAVLAAGVATPKAVIPVDLFGLPVAEEPLAEWAAKRKVEVISDAAQSFGAHRDGSPVGSLAPITTTSFYPAKPLGCYGDGGAVLCVEPATAEIVRSIREHGQSADRYDIVRLGVNGRLDSLQAAVLLAKLTVFEQELVARRAVAAGYGERLRAVAILGGDALAGVGAGVRRRPRVECRVELGPVHAPRRRRGRPAVGRDEGRPEGPSRRRRHSHGRLLPAADAPAARLRELRPRRRLAAGQRKPGGPRRQPADAPLPRPGRAGPHLRADREPVAGRRRAHPPVPGQEGSAPR